MAQLRYPRPSTRKWEHLPWELRHMVLGQVATASSSRAGYACVCRDWQVFFETRNFSCLVLNASDLSDLRQIVVGRRRELVKHIALHVKLGPYTYTEEPADKTCDENHSAFTNAIWGLWEVLSTWRRKRDVNGNNNGQLTLELLAECPTDISMFNPGRLYSSKIDLYSSYLHRNSLEVYKRHCGAYFQPANSRKSWIVWEMEQTDPAIYRDLWRHHKRTILNEGTLKLNFSYLPSHQTKRRRRLPQVDVVTNFLVRREYYRNIDPGSLRQIFQSLPQLKSINLERSIYINATDERDWNKGILESLLLPIPHLPPSPGGNDSASSSPRLSMSRAALPDSLKRLTLFAEARESFHKQSAMPVAKNTHPNMAKSLVTLSRNLQQLSVSFLIDAEDFFRSSLYWPTAASDEGGEKGEELYRHRLDHEPRWEHLTSLALTSKRLIMPQPSSSSWMSRINDLLFAAAVTAKMMPKLEVMEIWNGDKGQAGIFRYVSGSPNESTSAEIVWQGTQQQQHLALSERVLKAWREVALEHNPRCGLSLSVSMIPIEPTSIEGAAYVLDYLRLGKLVMHEVSAWQGQWEQRLRP
ncbi:hypothetical protein QBC46DRAFT_340003 [Diplogelasinospora grovesii]|uniref:DUF6546 domain-containing protein n=1 Tax=Diplogelasinospora grovesii TaxID=303347 RepID=A0AAN6NCU8_9PEZI|nr:hypothetical protein QBC46DRAFT_340003 [Diplogelasinospora grovesii]